MYVLTGELVPGPVSPNNMTPTFTLAPNVPTTALIVAISELNLVPTSKEALQFAELSKMIRTFGASPVTDVLPEKISVSSANAASGPQSLRHNKPPNKQRNVSVMFVPLLGYGQ
jgi:hypothetical protein